MPCNTVRATSVDLGKVNVDLLNAAIKALGWRNHAGGDVMLTSGKLTMLGGNVEARTAELKRAYSAEVVKSQAKKFGWAIKETAKYQYEVVKRSV